MKGLVPRAAAWCSRQPEPGMSWPLGETGALVTSPARTTPTRPVTSVVTRSTAGPLGANGATCLSEKPSSAGKALGHQVDNGDADSRFAALRQRFVVLTQPTAAPDPGEGALDDPALRQCREGCPPSGFLTRSISHRPVTSAQTSNVPASPPSAQSSHSRGKRPTKFSSTRLAPSRSRASAACTTTTNSRGRVSTTR